MKQQRFAVRAVGAGAALIVIGRPQDPAAGTKILWISRVPRDGAPLRITATPLGLAAPLVRIVQPANSGSGEIYPSIVDVPFAGCWHIELAWGPNTDAVDLTYLPGR